MSAIRIFGGALAVSMMFPVVSASAAEWSDNWAYVNYGPSYKFPGTRFDTVPGTTDNYRTKDVPVTTLGFTHVSGYKYGSNYLNVELIHSGGNNDPQNGNYGTQGANEIYGVYRHTLGLSAVTGMKLGGGFIRDYGFDLGFNFGVKNNAINAAPFPLVAGPRIKFDVPGFWDVWLHVYKEIYSNNRFNTPTRTNYDAAWSLGTAWGIDVGPGKFNGFWSNIGPKGKDTSGVDTKTETLIEAFYMFDVGQLTMNKKGTLYAGLGFQYWKNKYGIKDLNDNFPQLLGVWKF